MSKSASPAKPAKSQRTIRPAKAANLTAAVQTAAAYSAYHGEYKPTPSKADWNKLVQVIGVSSGAAPLRVPYKFGLTLLPVWTAAYKAAQKGHVPGKSLVIPKPKPRKPKAQTPAPTSTLPPEPVQMSDAEVGKLVKASLAAGLTDAQFGILYSGLIA